MAESIEFADIAGEISSSSPPRPRIEGARLQAFLEAQSDINATVQLGELIYVEDAGGSNGIALFDADIGGLRNSFVLRYAPGEQLLKQKRFDDEFHTLRAVRKAGIPAPIARWCDPTDNAIGHPFLIMERVTGRAPSNRQMYNSGLLAEVTPEQRRAMLLEVAGFHGRLRRAAITPDHVPHLTNRGEGRTPIERELNWWLAEAKLVAQSDDPRLVYLVKLVDWMITHQPDARPATLVHGDAQVANMMFHNGQLAAALDWELSYLGHNEADLALVVMLISAHVTPGESIEGLPSKSELIARYEMEAGAPVEHWAYFRMFNLLKVSAIMMMTARHMPPAMASAMWELNAAQRATAWDEARAEADMRAKR